MSPRVNSTACCMCRDLFQQYLDQLPHRVKHSFALPGRERQDSVSNGLDAISVNAELVAVHDSARPLMEASDAAACMTDARQVHPGQTCKAVTCWKTAHKAVHKFLYCPCAVRMNAAQPYVAIGRPQPVCMSTPPPPPSPTRPPGGTMECHHSLLLTVAGC